MRIGGKRSIRWLGAAIVAMVAVGWWLAPYLTTTAFLLDIAGVGGTLRRVLPVRVRSYETRDIAVPTRYGPLAARLYRSAAPAARTVVVFPGIHGGGPDEPRLAAFCGRLSSTGLTVVCAPLPELRQFLITPRSTDAIEDVTTWAIRDRTLAPDGRVGLVGVSFAGGLALVAAGRPSLAGHLHAVLSLGGYGDLPRVLRFLCTGRLPDGSERTPHEYGLAVIALGAATRVVPSDQVNAYRGVIRTYLEASLDESPGQPKAAALIAEARIATAALPEPSHGLLTAILDRDRDTLGRALLPWIEELSDAPALSPERSPATTAPVFLLHGHDDNVIPSTETPLMAGYLERHGDRPVWLLTPLLTHAQLLDHARLLDEWQLVQFWKTLLGSLEQG